MLNFKQWEITVCQDTAPVFITCVRATWSWKPWGNCSAKLSWFSELKRLNFFFLSGNNSEMSTKCPQDSSRFPEVAFASREDHTQCENYQVRKHWEECVIWMQHLSLTHTETHLRINTHQCLSSLAGSRLEGSLAQTQNNSHVFRNPPYLLDCTETPQAIMCQCPLQFGLPGTIIYVV